MKEAGIFAALVSATYVLFLTSSANTLLIKVMRKAGRTHRSYGDVTEFFLGDTAKWFVELMIASSQISVLIIYLQYIGQQINEIFCEVTKGKYGC